MGSPTPARFTTGLLLALPELAEFTARWRSTSYAPAHPGLTIERRFPPHITLLTPWASPTDDDEMARLHALAAAHGPLDLEFAEAQLFAESGVVWLRPTPQPGLTALLQDVLGAFPEYPPYDGMYPEPTLHVTVSADGSPNVLDEVRQALADDGPARAHVKAISVFARDADSVWRRAVDVPLGR